MPVSYTAAIASRRRLAASGEEERTCSRLPPPQRPIHERVHGQTDPTARVVGKDLQSLKLDEREPVYLLIRLPGRTIYRSCCGDLSTSFLCSVKTPRRHDGVSNQTLVYRQLRFPLSSRVVSKVWRCTEPIDSSPFFIVFKDLKTALGIVTRCRRDEKPKALHRDDTRQKR